MRVFLIHIDFGFLLGSSPGGDLGFEVAGFKFTLEMVELLGGTQEAALYQWFVELAVRGFLAVRSRMDEVVALVSIMQHSSLPFFRRPDVIKNLVDRFHPARDESFAAESMIAVVRKAHDNMMTNIYDKVQLAQQQIWYYQGKV